MSTLTQSNRVHQHVLNYKHMNCPVGLLKCLKLNQRFAEPGPERSAFYGFKPLNIIADVQEHI